MSQTRRCVLIVDDEVSVLSYYSIVLRGAGYEVIEAKDGALASRLALRVPPDLVLFDLQYPKASRENTVQGFRERFPDTAILVTSGFDRASALERGLIPDDVPLLQKPFSPAILRKLVAEMLEQVPVQKRGPHLNLPDQPTQAMN